MAITYVGASRSQQDHLNRSQERIRKCIRSNQAVIPRRLYSQLNDMLDKNNKDSVIELQVTPHSAGYWGFGGSYIEINPRSFSPWKENGSTRQDPPRLTAVLLHELVHVAGGEELDAEFFENRLFTRKDGATLPTPEDETDFTDNNYKGYFVRLDPKGRRVRDLQSGRALGILKRRPVIDVPKPNGKALQPNNSGEGDPMANGKQEQLASIKIATLEKRKKQMGVRVVVEFTGYLDKANLMTFMNGIRNTLKPHLEGNGGGG